LSERGESLSDGVNLCHDGVNLCHDGYFSDFLNDRVFVPVDFERGLPKFMSSLLSRFENSAKTSFLGCMVRKTTGFCAN